MKFSKKVLVVFMSLCIMTLPCATAFAHEVSAPEDVDVTSRQSVGSLLTGGCNNFYGDGTIEVYLDSGHSWADIQAGTGPSSASGSVHISVKFPDGEWYDLGRVLASADHTSYREFSYCPKGTYLFLFESTTNDWIQVYANIYK